LPRLTSKFFSVKASSFSDVRRTEPVASLEVGVRCGCTVVYLARGTNGWDRHGQAFLRGFQ
jgi:hypothetical protein